MVVGMFDEADELFSDLSVFSPSIASTLDQAGCSIGFACNRPRPPAGVRHSLASLR